MGSRVLACRWVGLPRGNGRTRASRASSEPGEAAAEGMEPAAREVVEELLERMPPVRYACAYGSAARRQPGGGGGGLDVLLAVDDAPAWHRQNLKRNRDHYGPACLFGGRGVSGLAKLGARVHFNSMVPFRGWELKYGVMATADLLSDLRSWTEMYVAGRLQKPVEEIVGDQSIREARGRNLRMALAAALLQLPSRFTREELRQTIVNLSYAGDVRMAVGAEDRHKVARIAGGSSSELDCLYEVANAEFGENGFTESLDGSLLQNASRESRERLLLELPTSVVSRLALELQLPSPTTTSVQDIAAAASSHPELAPILRRAIGRLVWWSSTRQSIAGVFATGPLRATRYVYNKLRRAGRASSGSAA